MTKPRKHTTTVRPHYSSIRPYTWKEADTHEHIDGVAIFKGKQLAIHLTKAETIKLATELIEHAEHLESRAP